MESTSIYAALAAVQSELKAPKGQMNTFGGYRYRSCEDILEAVKPILKAHDLLLTLSDEPKVLEGWHYIEATAKLESLYPPCSRRRTTNTRRTRTPKSKISFMEMPYFNHCMLSKRHNSGFFMPF